MRYLTVPAWRDCRKLLITLLAAAGSGLPASAGAADGIEEIVVTSQRREQARLEHRGNIDRIGADRIDAIRHQHAHELFSRVAGAWISRGSGQENLTAIRSPVLTGAGSCGAFLLLEDGIPIRPAGFCNVNALFEIDIEQARAVEVLRGPGDALYGSNALHGIVNVLMPEPDGGDNGSLALEIGANDFVRGRAALPFAADTSWLLTAVFADDGGFRDDSGYRQTKLHAKRDWQPASGSLLTGLTYTNLDQETAGFIIGEDAYKDARVNRSNPNPEAFRRAESLRAYGILQRSLPGVDLDLRPYARYSDMEFLQHFLPGQPLEENGHVSAGLLAAATVTQGSRLITLGLDIEWSDLFLRETQAGPADGSAFLRATRPVGKHYDYAVTSFGIAPYLQLEQTLGDRWSLGAGIRIEHLRYDYDNRMLSGNTRDDGSVCGFGGCLYTRPEDRSDEFANVAPKLSLAYRPGETAQLYAVLAHGFRAPQATELYRLQSGQQVADLDSERVDSFEIGWRRITPAVGVDIAAYAMRKRNSVFRDADGFNVSGARTRHEGVEVSVDWRPTAQVSVSLDATYARHSYDFNRVAARGETFVAGRDVDTAPRWLANVELDYRPAPSVDLNLQLLSTGDYYLDAENRFRYPGHAIANFRAGFEVAPRLRLVLRLNNVSDREIADRADYAFGNYRYFPGRGRELFAEIQYLTRNESP